MRIHFFCLLLYFVLSLLLGSQCSFFIIILFWTSTITASHWQLFSQSFLFGFQYDVVPIQPSVVICSCSHPSMVRNHPDSCSPLAIPGASSSHCPTMEGSASEARAVGTSASSQVTDLRAQPAVQTPQPRKKKPEDFKFGKILGEGSFSTVCFSHSTAVSELYLGRCLYMLTFFY